MSSYSTFALKANGGVWTWGNNTSGQLGGQSVTSRSSPVVVVGAHSFVMISLFGTYASSTNAFGGGLKADGSAWCWGYNNAGQLGDRTIASKSSPVLVVGNHSFISLRAGDGFSMGLKSNGQVWCWGDSTYGQLGDNTRTAKSSPVLVVGAHSFIQIACGSLYAIAMKADGSVWAWGQNDGGQLGDQTVVSKSSPILVVGNHSFINVISMGKQSGGIKSNGQVWLWGLNTYGQLGDGTVASRSSPVLVLGTHSFIDISMGRGNTIALKADGSAWCWGRNTFGEMGDNTTTSRQSPVLVVGNHSFIQVAAQSEMSMGLKADGSLWTWGMNTFGELGTQNTTSRSSPVVVIGSHVFANLPDRRVIYSGGPVFSDSVTEPCSASDASTNLLTANASQTESSSSSDLLSVIATLLSSITESVSASDIQNFAGLIVVSQTETCSATDSQNGAEITSSSITESTSVLDSCSSTYMTAASKTETCSATDTSNGANQTPANMVKGPYLLFKGDNTKMQVMWQLDATSQGNIKWGLTLSYEIGSYDTTENGSGTDQHQHSYEIPSLTPGSIYYYRVYSGNQVYTGSFRAAPASNTACKLFISSDTHADIDSGLDFQKCFDTILDKVEADVAWQVMSVLSGDLRVSTQTEANMNSSFWLRSLTRSVEFMGKIPLIVARGNHDDVTILRKYFPYNFGASGSTFYYAFDYGNAHIVVLDFNIDYTIGGTQHNWMLNELSTTSKKHKIIVIHEGPYHDTGHHTEPADMATNLVPYFQQYKVQLVLFGHNHYYSRCYHNGIEYMNNGTIGGTVYACSGSGTDLKKYESGWCFGMLSLTNNDWSLVEVRPRDQTLQSTQDNYQTSFDGTAIESIFLGEISESVSAVDASSSGKITSASVTESCSASDSQSCGTLAIALITETVSLIGLQDSNKLVPASEVESSSASDLIASTLFGLGYQTDSANAVDSSIGFILVASSIVESSSAQTSQDAQVLGFEVSEIESASANDSSSVILIYTSIIQESVSSQDSCDAKIAYAVSIIESCSSTDSSSLTSGVGVVENLTATSNQSAIYLGIASNSESCSALDTCDAIAVLNSNIIEVAPLLDVTSGIMSSVAEITEGTSSLDSCEGSNLSAGYIYPIGMSSQETFGGFRILIGQTITLNGIPTGESFGGFRIKIRRRSSFVEQMERDLEEIAINPEEFAEEVKIIFPDSSTKDINAIFDNESVDVDPETGASVMSRRPLLWIQTSKLNQQITKGFKVEVRGVIYQIVKDEPDGTGLTQLVLQKAKTV